MAAKFTLKTILISIFLFSLSLHSIAQSVTTRAIFDYDIGDEFQSHGNNNNGPPQASRTKIIGKWFSQNADTVTYVFKNNDYISSFNPSPSPHLDYTFFNYIDTLSYTNLDSSILYYLSQRSDLTNYNLVGYTFDTTTIYCQNKLHKFVFSTGGSEPDITEIHLSKGLGALYYYHNSASAVPAIDFEAYTFYYKKGSKVCGIADTVGLSVEIPNSKSGISIFPNPSSDKVHIHLPDNKSYLLEVFDMNSRNILSKLIQGEDFIFSVNNYDKGIYILKLSNESKFFTSRLIVK